MGKMGNVFGTDKKERLNEIRKHLSKLNKKKNSVKYGGRYRLSEGDFEGETVNKAIAALHKEKNQLEKELILENNNNKKGGSVTKKNKKSLQGGKNNSNNEYECENESEEEENNNHNNHNNNHNNHN